MNDWTPAEDALVCEVHDDYIRNRRTRQAMVRRLLMLLPHRSPKAIHFRLGKLRPSCRRCSEVVRRWKPHEVETLLAILREPGERPLQERIRRAAQVLGRTYDSVKSRLERDGLYNPGERIEQLPPPPTRKPAPTRAPIGSEEKVRVLTERLWSGEELWHPLDERRWA